MFRKVLEPEDSIYGAFNGSIAPNQGFETSTRTQESTVGSNS